MFPHAVSHSGATSDLSVDLRIDVELRGLAPVDAHRLHVGLTAAGLRCSTVPASDELAPPPESTARSGRTLVAVVPAGDSATVGVPDAGRHAAVHVLAEASVQAYSDALRAGATGAFAHDAELADVVRIVLCAGLGLTVLPVDVARALDRRSLGAPTQLTSRDVQSLCMLADGATVAEVGRQFALSEREMYGVLSGTYQRLGASNRTEAMLLAQRYGLLDAPRPPSSAVHRRVAEGVGDDPGDTDR